MCSVRAQEEGLKTKEKKKIIIKIRVTRCEGHQFIIVCYYYTFFLCTKIIVSKFDKKITI